jgi:hypothetical protein
MAGVDVQTCTRISAVTDMRLHWGACYNSTRSAIPGAMSPTLTDHRRRWRQAFGATSSHLPRGRSEYRSVASPHTGIGWRHRSRFVVGAAGLQRVAPQAHQLGRFQSDQGSIAAAVVEDGLEGQHAGLDP